MTTTIQSSKQLLRQQMRTHLKSISEPSITLQSERVMQKLMELPQVRQAKNVSIYLSMGGEINTSSIVKELYRQSKRVYIPRCRKELMQMVHIPSLEQLETLPKNKWGIPEPPFDASLTEALETSDGLELILMPGLCFNRQGFRLGHGRGYYDKYLASCFNWAQEHGRPRPTTIALALSEQVIDEEIPHDEFDLKPDMILTADALFNINNEI